MLNEILFTKIEEDGATYYTAEATFNVLALFLKIALLAVELFSFGHIGAVIEHRWTITCGVPLKISVTSTSQRQLMV